MMTADPLGGWSGLNLQYLIGKVDWLAGQSEEDKMRNMQTWDQAPVPETAFLGPHFWDKKLSMKMFNNDMESSDVHGGVEGGPGGGRGDGGLVGVGGGGYNSKAFSSESESPSPPHFQAQVSYNHHGVMGNHYNNINNFDNNNTTEHHHLKIAGNNQDWMEKNKTEENFKVSNSDLALATVPGINFDPTTRSFTAEELRPQPIIKKRRKMITPENKKDEKYWEKRVRNNVAAQRSREARRMKENQIALRASFLESQNFQLKITMKKLNIENNNIKVRVEDLMARIREKEFFGLD